jgi:L-fuculose-phosphate aldolase
MNSERDVREQIVDVGRKLYEKGFVAGTNGNLSVRFDTDLVITTPRGACMGALEPDALVATTLKGEVVDDRPGSAVPVEYALHLVSYILRPDVRSVVHAHPPTTTGFAAVGLPMVDPIVTDLVLGFDGVPLAKYAAPGSIEFAESIVGLVPGHDAIMLANHGAVTVGGSALDAFYKMDLLELTAKALLSARLLGGGRLLASEQVRELQAIKANMAAAARGNGCQSCSCSGDKMPTATPAGMSTRVGGQTGCLGCGACNK